ncbi:MAG: trypsin-like peptidase domain-containing protein [Moorea sp. SIO1G6]|uniref:S1 family peptidase n=1 Tax=Moorena sp. SIO1G6 TaxID=2607840 RepID=UPI0013C26725|nr:serine protease [Moorena sp. SIO1G6]NET63762.1 trypsin-like peptidase domain-containing protein [Moorena sp. SIO1G6]
MTFTNRLSIIFLGIFTAFVLIITHPPKVFSITQQQKTVDKISRITTVVVSEGLEKKGAVESCISINKTLHERLGSGVIVGKKGNTAPYTYYVLTALHVVPDPDTPYGIRTSDREVYPVASSNSIEQFGRQQGERNERIDGFDLAVIKFESHKSYYTAPVGNSDKIGEGDEVFVSGWPIPDDDRIDQEKRKRKTLSGKVDKKLTSPKSDGGFDLSYTNNTKVGMSGGPVFDSQGYLIAIHGRKYSGIKINNFINIIKEGKSSLIDSASYLSFMKASEKLIKAGNNNIELADNIEDIRDLIICLDDVLQRKLQECQKTPSFMETER